jgi:hypothetical protein
MNHVIIFGLLMGGLGGGALSMLIYQMLEQNGRMLLRLEALEKRLDGKAENEKQKAERDVSLGDPELAPNELSMPPDRKGEVEAPVLQSTAHHDGSNRFGNRSLANSKIKRDGLKTGTLAPEFRLPRLEVGELALSDLRGRFVLLVFSSPKCGPCTTLAPKLEKFHRNCPELELVMISQDEPGGEPRQSEGARTDLPGAVAETMGGVSRLRLLCHASGLSHR